MLTKDMSGVAILWRVCSKSAWNLRFLDRLMVVGIACVVGLGVVGELGDGKITVDGVEISMGSVDRDSELDESQLDLRLG
jgi:hypothetical protein